MTYEEEIEPLRERYHVVDDSAGRRVDERLLGGSDAEEAGVDALAHDDVRELGREVQLGEDSLDHADLVLKKDSNISREHFDFFFCSATAVPFVLSSPPPPAAAARKKGKKGKGRQLNKNALFEKTKHR